MCVIATIDTVDVQECSIPSFQKSSCRIELPECPDDELMSIVKEYCHLFCTTPGLTDVAHHFNNRKSCQSTSKKNSCTLS